MVRLALRRRGAAGGADLASHLSRFTVPWRRPIDVPLGRDHQVVRCVDAVCVHRPFRSTCLPRSLTAWTMLQRRHIDAQVRVGVRGATTDFASHAWVERNSAALGEDPAVIATFTALPLGTFLSPVAQESAPPTR